VSSNERGTLDGNREATHTGLVGKPTKPYRGASNAVELGTVLILGKSWIDAGHGSRSSRHCATRWRWHTVAFFASARTAGKRWPGRSCPTAGLPSSKSTAASTMRRPISGWCQATASVSWSAAVSQRNRPLHSAGLRRHRTRKPPRLATLSALQPSVSVKTSHPRVAIAAVMYPAPFCIRRL